MTASAPEDAVPPPDARPPWYRRGWFDDLARSLALGLVSVSLIWAFGGGRSPLPFLLFGALPAALHMSWAPEIMAWIGRHTGGTPLVAWAVMISAQWFLLLDGIRRWIRPKNFAARLLAVVLIGFIVQVFLFLLVAGSLC